jgi:hypothetical protein
VIVRMSKAAKGNPSSIRGPSSLRYIVHNITLIISITYTFFGLFIVCLLLCLNTLLQLTGFLVV